MLEFDLNNEFLVRVVKNEEKYIIWFESLENDQVPISFSEYEIHDF